MSQERRGRPKVEIPTTFGDRVRFEREVLGMPQVELARLAGLSKQTLSDIEKGKQVASHEQVVALADALHVSPSRILGRAPNWQPQVAAAI